MATAVLVGRGPRLYLVRLPAGSLEEFRGERGVEQLLDPATAELPPGLLAAVAKLAPATRLVAPDPKWRELLRSGAGRPVDPPSLTDLRVARARLPLPPAAEERSFDLALARAALERALRSPEEVLITLAREEERFERSMGREARAAEAFVEVPGSPLARYAAAWGEARSAFLRHHASLRSEVEREANELLPNLSHVVGARVAARLLAAAGGLPALGRTHSARLQLLGSRRRPSAERGPRYGLLYRADRMDDVPPSRRGAYARSLAALAAIAARADATTRAEIWPALRERRDRRVEALNRSGR